MITKIQSEYTRDLEVPTFRRNCTASHNQDKLSFKYYHYSSNLDKIEQQSRKRTVKCHSLVLQLEGEMHINWGEHKDVVIKAGEMYILPHGAEISGYIVGDVGCVVVKIKRGLTARELVALREIKKHEEFDKYEFKPMIMHPPMVNLAESVRNYLINGVTCFHLHEAKYAELYVILHWYYSLAENAQLFYVITGGESEFRNFILDNYKINTPINELVVKANMSRSTFNRKFKEAFNTTPTKWIDELTRQAIVNKASEPNVSVKDVMYELNIDNPSHFTQLCKRLCGVVPSELIRAK